MQIGQATETGLHIVQNELFWLEISKLYFALQITRNIKYSLWQENFNWIDGKW